MMKKRKTLWLVLILGLALITSCSESPLSDSEFALEAAAVCDQLAVETSSEENFSLSSVPYQQAADELQNLLITEESAPNAFLLRSGLSEYAEAADQLNEAIIAALVEGNITSEIQWMLFENGSVMYFPISEGILSIKSLDVDTSYGSALLAAQEKIDNAAEVLGLESCRIGGEAE